MSIDMAQFHQVFFEESFEGLDVMESTLLNLVLGDVDNDEINTIFRAAHSIKGGSGTFGFTAVSDFTHRMETLLDEMRDGRRQVTQAAVDVLLSSVDCLREMLAAIQDDESIDEAIISKNQQLLDLLLNGDAETETPTNTDRAEPSVDSEPGLENNIEPGWQIQFKPHSHLLQTGNEPALIFRELSNLGELTTTVDIQGLPDQQEFDPEACYLAWNLKVTGEISREDINEIFDWVESDCDLSIEALATQDGDIAKTHNELENSASELTQAENIAQDKSAIQLSDTNPVTDAPNQDKTEKAAVKVKSKAQDSSKVKSSSSIRVDTEKIDTLINMVGELVITQSMLSLVGEHFDINKVDQLKNGLGQLERHTRELQESVMNIRMLPISFVFSRFPRLIHDVSSKLGKKIDLQMSGENTEVDKSVIELITDPLVHLVRNSIDHGIELPETRLAVGKPETGTVNLIAYHRGGNIVIEVVDDGKGLDKELLKNKAIEKGLIETDAHLTEKQTYELIFHPGFSMAAELSDISGRGVGMDVVRKNIQTLGGNIEIKSELGKGATFAIHLPLTLAILDGQSIAVGDETYIVPLVSIIETISISNDMIHRVAGKGETFHLRNEFLPIVRMHEIFDVTSAKAKRLTEGQVVVVEGQGVRCGLFIDDLLGQQQVVIKSLEDNYRRIEGVSGATILGDGSVSLILDIPGLLRLANQ